jgi:hypothetical protein
VELSNTYKVYTIEGLEGDFVGVFIKSENSKFIDIEVKDYTYKFFSENREKFVSHIEYNEIINKFKI